MGLEMIRQKEEAHNALRRGPLECRYAAATHLSMRFLKADVPDKKKLQ